MGSTTTPATKQRIVDAAVALFATRGYEGTTIAAIADRVSMTDAGVLHHFRTKRALFWAVVELLADTQAEDFGEMVAPGGVQAIANLAGWGAVMEQRPDLVRLQVLLSSEGIVEDSDLHAYWRDRYRDLTGLLAALFRQAIEAGAIHPSTDAEWEASAIVAFLDGARLQWFYSDGARSIDAGFRAYIERLLDRIT
jgi:AcrR family transcriptional regulator